MTNQPGPQGKGEIVQLFIALTARDSLKTIRSRGRAAGTAS